MVQKSSFPQWDVRSSGARNVCRAKSTGVTFKEIHSSWLMPRTEEERRLWSER